MSKNVKFKVEKRSYPRSSAIVDIDVDDGVQEVTFGGDTCLDVDLYDVKKTISGCEKAYHQKQHCINLNIKLYVSERE